MKYAKTNIIICNTHLEVPVYELLVPIFIINTHVRKSI